MASGTFAVPFGPPAGSFLFSVIAEGTLAVISFLLDAAAAADSLVSTRKVMTPL